MINCDKLPMGAPPPGGSAPAWNLDSLQAAFGLGPGKSGRRQAERLAARHNLLPPPIGLKALAPMIPGFRHQVAEALMADVRKRRGKPVFLQLAVRSDGPDLIFANDARGSWHWVFRDKAKRDNARFLAAALRAFSESWGKPLLVFATPDLLPALRGLTGIPETVTTAVPACPEPVAVPAPNLSYTPPDSGGGGPAHLDRLEAEAMHIMREVVAQNSKPVMLYSVGKDSAVMLHVALKAFSPAKPPFPLLHVDTGWKFRAMYDFRDSVADATGMELTVHRNQEGADRGINPFDHGSALHTEIMKTEALKQALDAHGYDAAFGGARRDEERSRAKERIFSFRNSRHQWDPKNQRPELWSLHNSRVGDGGSLRVFPLSNWTEVDIWHYIRREGIPVVPLYFAAPRPVVEHGGTLVMVDDDRMPVPDPSKIRVETVRFRTLGCYPLTGAVPSTAGSVEDILLELLASRHSEREGRVIDRDGNASMEDKKKEGYF